jgi:phosphatidylinositol kinase/protein kinase (PI-3  family)
MPALGNFTDWNFWVLNLMLLSALQPNLKLSAKLYCPGTGDLNLIVFQRWLPFSSSQCKYWYQRIDPPLPLADKNKTCICSIEIEGLILIANFQHNIMCSP